jgi:hypothetical protein
MLTGTKIKRVLGELPLAAELDWALRGRGSSVDGFNLDELKAALPEWCAQVKAMSEREAGGRKVLVYATLHYWISHATLLSLALAGLGHKVTLAYSPYATWKISVSKFDLRRREAYARSVFKPAENLMDFQSFAVDAKAELPIDLQSKIEQVSVMDAQYSLQLEDVDKGSELFKLRFERNREAAAAAYAWIKDNQPDVVVIPNGLILEFGAIFQVARHLGVPVVSYEFGEQRDRIWLAHNTPVMLQQTKELWQNKKDQPFNENQRAQVKELFSTRQSAGLFKNFYRRWQNLPAEGGDAVRSKLGLDQRPVVVLAANVIGDSLTLGRATFTGDMSTWLRRTLAFFAARDDVQFVLRVHPGEKNLNGPSVADLVHAELPTLPPHMRVVAAEDPINTYDLIDIADLGLVYTTTVGLEMAMSGLPAIVVGETHYRDKGFTIDPTSWDDYFATLETNLANLEAARLNPAQVDTAWHYAYRFFFDYPQPFPWHLLHFWDDLKNVSLAEALTDEGTRDFGKTFDFVLGEPFEWEAAR